MQTPKDARYFGIEVQADDGAWIRVDLEALGGKWWDVGAADPEEVARRFAEIAGREVFARVAWCGADRRHKPFAHSLPFGASPTGEPMPEVKGTSAPSVPLPEAAAAPTAPEPAAAPAPAPPAAPVQQPPAPLTPAPLVAVPYQPPPPGAAADPLSMFVYIHSIQQEGQRRQEQTMANMFAVLLESERSRSREQLASMGAHYKAITDAQAQARDEIRALMAAQASKDNEGPIMAALAAKLAEMDRKLDEFAEPEDEPPPAAMVAHVPDNRSDAEKIVSAIGGLLNSPAGAAVANMLFKQQMAPAAAAPSPPSEEPAE